MCHIHTPEHDACMAESPLMVIRCLDTIKKLDLLVKYFNHDKLFIITNSNGIGENIFIKYNDKYILLESTDRWKTFISHCKKECPELYNNIISDDSFGWNIAGVGLINFSVNYKSASANYDENDSYIWDDEDWKYQRLLDELNETENIICSKVIYDNNELVELINKNKFILYMINFNNNCLQFNKY